MHAVGQAHRSERAPRVRDVRARRFPRRPSAAPRSRPRSAAARGGRTGRRTRSCGGARAESSVSEMGGLLAIELVRNRSWAGRGSPRRRGVWTFRSPRPMIETYSPVGAFTSKSRSARHRSPADIVGAGDAQRHSAEAGASAEGPPAPPGAHSFSGTATSWRPPGLGAVQRDHDAVVHIEAGSSSVNSQLRNPVFTSTDSSFSPRNTTSTRLPSRSA